MRTVERQPGVPVSDALIDQLKEVCTETGAPFLFS